MNRKLYIKWLLRQWLPLIFIFGAILLLVYFVPSLSGAIYPDGGTAEYYGGSYYGGTDSLFYTEVGNVNAGTSSIMTWGIMAAIVMPFFVFSYRFDKVSADTYGQIPAKSNEVRIIRILVGLCIVLSVLTIAFWAGNIAKVIRQACFEPAVKGYMPFYFFNYGYYALFYAYLLLIVASTYLFCCTILHLVGRVLDGLILLLVVGILMAGTVLFFCGWFNVFVHIATNGKGRMPFEYTMYDGLSALSNPQIACQYVFEPLICTSAYVEPGFDDLMVGMLYAYPIVKLALSVFVFICHEPSGEYFGKPGGINSIGKIMIHILAAMIALTMGIVWFYLAEYGIYIFFLMVFIYGIFLVCYYLMLSLYQKSFALKKADLIVFLSVVAVGIIVSVIFGFIGRSIWHF